MIEVLYMMRFSFVADHWQYLGSMSMIPLGVGAAARMFNQRPAAVRRIGPVIGSVVLAALSLLTWRQGYIYRDLETLWRDTLAKNPNAWMAQHNLGKVLQDRGNLAEAMNRYNQALSLKPEYADAHNNLAVVLIQFDRTQEAIGHWEEALRIKPGFADAHYNLGGALVRLGRLQEAIGHYELAARLKPDDAPTQNDLGAALAQIGRVDEGITHCEEALRLRPDYAEAHYNLGMAFAQGGKLQDAAQHWEQALRIKPDYSEAHYNLGVALEQMGKPIEAMRHWEQALKLWPDYPEAENKLAWWLAMLAPNEGGDPVRALSLAKSACKLTDNRSATHLDTLAAAYAAAGQFPEAISAAQSAIELALSAKQTETVGQIQARVELYQHGLPYRRPVPPVGNQAAGPMNPKDGVPPK
jgi:tetratricopeptide (TPR) repeat protein